MSNIPLSRQKLKAVRQREKEVYGMLKLLLFVKSKATQNIFAL